MTEPWPAIVDRARTELDGISHVDLYFGREGGNVCTFNDYETQLASGSSDVSMQEAVERCAAAWLLEMQARQMVKYRWLDFVEGVAKTHRLEAGTPEETL